MKAKNGAPAPSGFLLACFLLFSASCVAARLGCWQLEGRGFLRTWAGGIGGKGVLPPSFYLEDIPWHWRIKLN